ncbi:MAG: hypothetical protein IKY11_02190 [Rikenellaceae bacterium]|nr:hypothetical protein [Rikenellaceae bacterium]
MRKYILLFLLLAVGLSSEVYGQKRWRDFCPPGFDFTAPLLPRRDTVIMRGEEIEVGCYLDKKWGKDFEIVGYGKAKKSDYEKGSKEGSYNKYSIKLKPKQTTTYEFRWFGFNREQRSGRIVYVAKTAEEKKQLEEKIQAALGPYQFTTYQYAAPGYEDIKITIRSGKNLKELK